MSELAFRAVLILFGLACVATEVYGTYEYLWEKFGRWNYLVVGGLIVTSMAAILPMAAESARQNRQWVLAAFCWLAVPLTLTLVFTAAIQRTGQVVDTDEATRQQLVKSIKTAEAEIAESLAQLPIDKATVLRTCEVWGPKCTRAKDDQAATERKLTEARAVLKKQGVTVDDSLAKRIEAYIPWITKEQVQLYHPMLLPLTLAILGALALAAGCAGYRKVENVPEEPFPKPATELTAAPAIDKPAKPSRPQLVVNNDNRLFETLERLLTPAPGKRINVRDVYKAYLTQCRTEGEQPSTPAQFPLKKFCDAAGLKTRSVKGQRYLLDVQLASSMALAETAST
jgi:hypothetical protein